ncbi:hypothetical protein GOP47_0029847 [Adiantum capillus-veneris]|nr:hypothetical protein GOP47_0029847 [Adiantum capillus-veneris]
MVFSWFVGARAGRGDRIRRRFAEFSDDQHAHGLDVGGYQGAPRGGHQECTVDVGLVENTRWNSFAEFRVVC